MNSFIKCEGIWIELYRACNAGIWEKTYDYWMAHGSEKEKAACVEWLESMTSPKKEAT